VKGPGVEVGERQRSAWIGGVVHAGEVELRFCTQERLGLSGGASGNFLGTSPCRSFPLHLGAARLVRRLKGGGASRSGRRVGVRRADGHLGYKLPRQSSLYPRLRGEPPASRFAPVPTASTAGVQGRPRHRRSPPRAPVPPRQRPRPFSRHHHLQRLGVHAAVKRRSLQGLHLPSVSTSLPAKRSALGEGLPSWVQAAKLVPKTGLWPASGRSSVHGGVGRSYKPSQSSAWVLAGMRLPASWTWGRGLGPGEVRASPSSWCSLREATRRRTTTSRRALPS